MEYHGILYGKIGNKYFDTGKTSSDFDNISNQIEKMEVDKVELLESLENLTEYGSTGEDAVEMKREIKSIIQKHKPYDIK